MASWATSQQVPEPHNALSPDDLRDATLRQIVHLSVGGKTLRVHISNAFGTTPLSLTSVHIARPRSPGQSKIDIATDKMLRFSGKPDVTIPAGAEFISDPIEYPMPALSDLAISLHMNTPPEQQTGHPGSRTTSYFQHGDLVSAADMPEAKKVEHWYWIGSVDVNAAKDSASIVVLGDSITDGRGSTTDENNRWTDILAIQLQANHKTSHVSVLNHGIGGNHLLTDGLGPNALARVDRDIIAQTGVRYLIVLEGVNDLGGTKDSIAAFQVGRDLIDAYDQMISAAHGRGLKVFGATILPFKGSSYYNTYRDSVRNMVNEWIRNSGHFDAVIDFDKAIRDPNDMASMLMQAQSDYLHPNELGYKMLGDYVDLSLFK